MPTDQASDSKNEAQEAAAPDPGTKDQGEPLSLGGFNAPAKSTSRWVDYDTHELLEMISDLEDERRMARLREGFWIAILVHALIFAGIVLLPKYVFKAPIVVDSSNSVKQHEDFTYMDSPKWQPKVEIKPVPIKPPVIDKKTLDEMNLDEMKKQAQQAPPTPAPQQQATATPPSPIPPAPQSQSQIEAPRPAAVPARPNFAFGSQNPAEALRDAMKGAARNPSTGMGRMPSGGLRMHPGAGAGGLEILSDTQGVDFNGWLERWLQETMRTWDPLIPDEVNPPIYKSGQLQIRFKILPNGRLMDGSMVLEGSSGDVALDRAAWGALTGSNYPPLPRDFHGPYLELRALFQYNMEPQR